MASYINIGSYTSISGSSGTTSTSVDTGLEDYADYVWVDGIITLATPSTPTEAWFQFVLQKNTEGYDSGGDNAPIRLYNTNGDSLLVITALNNDATHTVDILGGVTTSMHIPASKSVFDIHVVVDNAGAGIVEIYQDSVIIISQTSLVNGLFGIDRLELRGSNYVTADGDSKYIYHRYITGIGDSPTVGRVAYNKAAAVDGTDVAWIGDVTNIDEGLSINDGLVISSDVTGDRSTFNTVDIIQNSSLIVAGVSTQASHDATGVTNYQHTIKIGGVNYDQGALAPTTVLSPYISATTINPNTGLVWTVADFNAAEFGVVSI